ncbi:MAG: hypothetical protein NT099_09640 [Candidatus Saganbacteria bacterium]|nr:hypothetical protein [Candidatus Saganbacteria bacterium]
MTTTTTATAALPIKTISLLPPMEKETAKFLPTFKETETADTPQTEWALKVGELEKELAALDQDPNTTAVSYYKFFESVRGLISYAYASYSDSTALAVVGRLNSIKDIISPRITQA